MILTRLRLALALATLSAGLSPALASDPYCLGTQCFPTMAVIDPNTGKAVASTTQGTVTNGTDVSCAATTLCTLSSATSRKYLSIINTSASGTCRIGYGITPTATRGDPLNSATAANGQGGTRTFETNFVPTGTVQAICTADSTLAVLEGN